MTRDLATMCSLVGSVGFPIAIALIVSFKVILDRFLKSMGEVIES